LRFALASRTFFSFSHQPEASMDNSPFPQSDNMSNMNKTTTGVDTSAAGVQGNINKAVDPAHRAVDKASGVAHETVDRLASSASRLAGRLDERTRGMSDAPMKAWDYSKNSVQEHPMQAIGVALLVGYVLGRLTGSRNYYSEY
jgi:ElaB/YqjD/DUF883 family membrane-anchored ribosome-binding protein